MFDFLKTLFNPPPPPSSTTAKERLRLVLLSDHLSLSPETLAALKADLLAVISRYVEIDSSHADVTFEHRENDVAVLASIPITGVRERTQPPAQAMSQATIAPTSATAIAAAEPEVEVVRSSADVAQATQPLETHPSTTNATNATENASSQSPATGTVSAATRRRRRKKAQNLANRPGASAQPVGKPAQA